MLATLRDVLWDQFGASIDMLENAIRACPDELWNDDTRQPEFWYLVYHTLFFLDLYLSDATEGFAPPPPFTLDELVPSGVMPERVYTKDELLSYLAHGRNKARARVERLRADNETEPCRYGWIDRRESVRGQNTEPATSARTNPGPSAMAVTTDAGEVFCHAELRVCGTSAGGRRRPYGSAEAATIAFL